MLPDCTSNLHKQSFIIRPLFQVQVQVKNFVVPPLLKERRCITILLSQVKSYAVKRLRKVESFQFPLEKLIVANVVHVCRPCLI